jgi:hypothetical protein
VQVAVAPEGLDQGAAVGTAVLVGAVHDRPPDDRTPLRSPLVSC